MEQENQNISAERTELQSRKKLRISDVILALRKHALLIVICCAAGLILGVVLSVVSHMRGEISRQYAIKSSIAVTSQNENGLFTAQSSDPNSNDIYLAEEMVDSVIYVLKSDQTLKAAVDRLELPGITAKDIYNNLVLSQYHETQIIEITLYWRSAQEGVEILSAINEVAPRILIDILKIGNVSVINEPTAKYLIGGNINATMWGYMALLGLLLGVGYALLELLLRPTLLNSCDMEQIFSLEVLGEIPERKNYFRKKRNLLLENEENDNGAEILDNYVSAAHILKNRIQKLDHPCICVTSAMQNEGKTTVTAYLAVQLAEMGMKVLMVDFDFRNPKLSGLFLNRVEYVNSIRALYRGEAAREDAITRLTGNLDILPAVLESRPKALLDMIASLKTDYDVILMDTAPVGQVADTMSLNQLADIALMVVRFDGAAMEMIRDALARLNKSGMQVIGCVVNGTKTIGKRRCYSGCYSQELSSAGSAKDECNTQ